MKFENPIMNISKFDMENIITTSTNLSAAENQADEKVAQLTGSGNQALKVSVVF